MNEEKYTVKEYWKEYVCDYISCCTDNYDDLTEEQINEIVNSIFEDDRMWQAIDETVDYYIRRIKNNE